jgi:hypothetical protein
MDILPYMIFSHEVKRPFDKRSYEHTDFNQTGRG